MKKYFLMAIGKGNINAMNYLANYFEKKDDYENMMKYYLMAIEKGDINAMRLDVILKNITIMKI